MCKGDGGGSVRRFHMSVPIVGQIKHKSSSSSSWHGYKSVFGPYPNAGIDGSQLLCVGILDFTRIDHHGCTAAQTCSQVLKGSRFRALPVQKPRTLGITTSAAQPTWSWSNVASSDGSAEMYCIGIYSTICRMLSMERQLRSARRLSFTKALEMVGQRGEHMVASFLDTQLLPSLSFTFLSISWFFLAKGFPMRVLVSQAAYVLHVVLTCPGLASLLLPLSAGLLLPLSAGLLLSLLDVVACVLE